MRPLFRSESFRQAARGTMSFSQKARPAAENSDEICQSARGCATKKKKKKKTGKKKKKKNKMKEK